MQESVAFLAEDEQRQVYILAMMVYTEDLGEHTKTMCRRIRNESLAACATHNN